MIENNLDSRLKPQQPAEIVGVSPWAHRIRNDIRVVSRHASTVLVTGPSGTGKELVARSLHAASDRSDHPFVPVDCAAASETLFASQLFGHERGAFTGANSPSLGAFRAAHGGTIFLDEIGELDLPLQAKLLRTLQQRVVTPVGGVREHAVDVRVVAATNRDLQQEMQANRFREDLYYRLHVVSLRTQALNHRPEDIPYLIHSILARLEIHLGIRRKRISPEALDRLCNFDWPGNVRQLGNVLERAAMFSDGVIEPTHLPDELQGARTSCTFAGPSGPAWTVEDAEEPSFRTRSVWPTMEDVTRKHLRRTLEHTEFNQTAAARLLKLDRNAVRRMAVRLGISSPNAKPLEPGSPS